MSRHDRGQERKRLLIVGAIIVAFFAGFFLWGHSVNNGFDDTGREVRW